MKNYVCHWYFSSWEINNHLKKPARPVEIVTYLITSVLVGSLLSVMTLILGTIFVNWLLGSIWCIHHLSKGPLISKYLIGVFNFFQKMNENKLTWGITVVKSNLFVHFLEEMSSWKKYFDSVWPLVKSRFYNKILEKM